MAKVRSKFTTSSKVTLSALSIMSFFGGWNVIGHLAQKPVKADEPATPLPAPMNTATPWPTLSTQVDLAPIPTMFPTLTRPEPLNLPDLPQIDLNALPAAIAPIPTLAALPPLAPLAPMPTMAPPPPMPAAPQFAPAPTKSGGS